MTTLSSHEHAAAELRFEGPFPWLLCRCGAWQAAHDLASTRQWSAPYRTQEVPSR